MSSRTGPKRRRLAQRRGATSPTVRSARSDDGPEFFFDSQASQYDAAYDSVAVVRHALQRRRAAVIRHVGPGPGLVLDAGMGSGRLLSELHELGWSPVGIDVALGMVTLAKDRLSTMAGGVVQARIEVLPLRRACCRTAIATGVLEYVQDLAQAVHELSRVVQPGGRVVVTMPNRFAVPLIWGRYVWYPLVRIAKRWLPLGQSPPPSRPGPVSRAQLARLMRNAGLSVVDVEYIGVRPLPAPLDQLLPSLALRLATRLESAAGAAARVIATQVVVTASKSREGE